MTRKCPEDVPCLECFYREFEAHIKAHKCKFVEAYEAVGGAFFARHGYYPYHNGRRFWDINRKQLKEFCHFLE